MKTLWVLALFFAEPEGLVYNPDFSPVVFENQTTCEETSTAQVVLESYRPIYKDKEIILLCLPTEKNK